jgi:hypothetical protein
MCVFAREKERIDVHTHMHRERHTQTHTHTHTHIHIQAPVRTLSTRARAKPCAYSTIHPFACRGVFSLTQTRTVVQAYTQLNAHTNYCAAWAYCSGDQKIWRVYDCKRSCIYIGDYAYDLVVTHSLIAPLIRRAMVKQSCIYTGDYTYEMVAKRSLIAVWSRRSEAGLVGGHIDIASGEWTQKDAGIGTSVDSYYEYMLKGTTYACVCICIYIYKAYVLSYIYIYIYIYMYVSSAVFIKHT